MKSVWIIALNTYREIIRDRILYGLIVFALLLIGLSLALGQLSFAEQAKISMDFGFTAIHLSAVILAIFLGSSLVAKEIDKKTILTLLARPLTRLEFLVGKSLGLLLVITTLVGGLSLVLSLVALGMGLVVNFSFLVGILGVLLESILLLGVTLFFSSFARPIMVVVFSVGFFLIGHWVENLSFFASRSQSQSFKIFSGVVGRLFPNLEQFNWRSLFIYGESVELAQVLISSIYSLCWFILTLTAAALVIRRKDFV